MTWPRKCAAHRRDGQPCGNYALNGARTCRMHGSATRAAKASARVRFLLWKGEQRTATMDPDEFLALLPLDPMVEAYLAGEDC